MKEDILKYFTNKLPQESTEVMPQNIKNVVMPDILPTLNFSLGLITTNDGNYVIRFGGDPRVSGTNRIEVYSVSSLENFQAVYTFSDLKIYGHNFVMSDLKQDEEGRFYSTGYYVDANQDIESYFILYNNFVQDGYIKIRKFYTQSQMGISNQDNIYNVVKRNGSAEYFFDTTNKLYKFKIDIVQGNSLSVYNYVDDGTLTLDYFDETSEVFIIDNNLIKLEVTSSLNSSDIITASQYKKMVIDIDNEPSGTYHLRPIKTTYKGNNIIEDPQIENFKFYEILLTPSGNNYRLTFNIIDFNGNVTTFNTENYFNGTENIVTNFTTNYCSILDRTHQTLDLYYYEIDNSDSLIKFYHENNYSGTFNQVNELKQYNLVTLVGLHNRKSLTITTNLYSQGYSSTPYTNINFLIPQYLNLYSEEVENVNSNDSIIYSRDAINRFLAGNQLTATFNVPNYLLNDSSIKTERVLGQTNLAISNELNTIQKNRFESLFYTYIQNLSIIDNTNGNNQQNMTASNRLSRSIWDKLDIENSACLKIRVTDENGDYIIREIDSITINDTEATLEYYVEGNVKKIEYLSNDLQTVYATFRCDLTVEEYGLLTEDGIELLTEDGIELEGATTNTIEQTIEVV
jgi:hypothetical protein